MLLLVFARGTYSTDVGSYRGFNYLSWNIDSMACDVYCMQDRFQL